MSDRTRRVGESIKEELALMVERGQVKDPRIGFITFTDVDLSKDIKHARVYFSSLGNTKQKAAAAEGLNSARGFIRTELGKRLRLKYTPELEFKFDETVEASAKISKLLHQLRAKEENND